MKWRVRGLELLSYQELVWENASSEIKSPFKPVLLPSKLPLYDKFDSEL